MIGNPKRHKSVAQRIWFVMFVAGCASFVPTPTAPWKFDDARSVPPDEHSVNRVPPQTGDNAIAAPAGPDSLPNDDSPSDFRLPETSGAAKSTEARRPQGPTIIPQKVVVPAKLNLVVQAPRRTQVGSGATFHLTVSNTGDEPVEDIVVETEFDRALVFPGRREKKVRRTLRQLMPAESKEISLLLLSDQTGNHCCRFTVTSKGHESVWKSVCVDFLEKQIDLRIVGPTRRTVGSRAEFTVKLVNVASNELKEVQVVLSHASVLEARELTNGYVNKSGGWLWELGKLRAGEGVQLQAEFDCRDVADNACIDVRVSAEGVADEAVEQCLKVVPVPGILELYVDDGRDPIKVGDETEYVVRVRNRGQQLARQVQLQSRLPSNMRLVSAAVRGGDRQLNVNFKVRGQDVVFDSVASLESMAELKFTLQTKAVRIGDGGFVASVSHASSRVSVDVHEFTTVNR